MDAVSIIRLLASQIFSPPPSPVVTVRLVDLCVCSCNVGVFVFYSLVGFLENVHVRGILGYKLGTRLFNIIQVC